MHGAVICCVPLAAHVDVLSDSAVAVWGPRFYVPVLQPPPGCAVTGVNSSGNVPQHCTVQYCTLQCGDRTALYCTVLYEGVAW